MNLEVPSFATSIRSIEPSKDAQSEAPSLTVVPRERMLLKNGTTAVPSSTFMIPLTRRQVLGLRPGPTGSQCIKFSEMSAGERVAYLWKTKPAELALFVIGGIGSVYLILRAIHELSPGMSLIAKAFAETAHTGLPSFTTARDGFDWMVGGVMSVAFLLSLGMIFFASNEKKIDFGSKFATLMAGFLAGFLTSKPPT